jgi:hypothetical protein
LNALETPRTMTDRTDNSDAVSNAPESGYPVGDLYLKFCRSSIANRHCVAGEAIQAIHQHRLLTTSQSHKLVLPVAACADQ